MNPKIYLQAPNSTIDLAVDLVCHVWLSERATLTSNNVNNNEINFTIQHSIAGESMTYTCKSVDSVTSQNRVVHFPLEIINSRKLPGLPPDNQQL